MNFNFRFKLATLAYIIVVIIVVFLLTGVYTFFKVGSFSEDLAHETALQEAKRYAETLRSFRGLYTSEVVAEVAEKKIMKISHDYKDPQYDSIGAIPLPATLSMMLAEKMTTGNTTVKLYSKYPFPWRKDRQLTEFEVKAFEYFERNRDSDSAYYEVDKENQLVRYAIPDKMVSISCVNCHNNHPQSPKTGWQLGDVRGAISIVKPANSTRVMEATDGTFLLLSLITVAIFMALGIVIARIRNVRRSIQETNAIIEQLKMGDFPEKHTKVPQNEMERVVQGLNTVQDNFKKVVSFAQRVGKGDLHAEFDRLSDKDSLGIALIEMRNNLKKVNEDDAKRNWATAGLAQLGETLRSTGDAKDLYDKIVQFITKYTKSNQAALFVLNNENDEDEFLELVACYAYDRKKHLQKKIGVGEGMVGQCYLEGELIYNTVIPNNYVKITSGLGEATPTSLLLIPIKTGGKVYGVFELLSFKKFEEFERDFLKKAAESIASIIATAKVNERTRQLLAQAQQQAEELKSQEEEMRQNMEELAATQEEMGRKEKEYVSRIETLEAERVGQNQSLII